MDFLQVSIFYKVDDKKPSFCNPNAKCCRSNLNDFCLGIKSIDGFCRIFRKRLEKSLSQVKVIFCRVSARPLLTGHQSQALNRRKP